jgi:recombination-promoting nuclease RpnB
MTVSKLLTTPHDDFFNIIMRYPHIVKDALKAYLPKEVSAKIDWRSVKLTRIDTRSIDDKHKKTIADVLFLAQNQQKHLLHLLFHIEHFSTWPVDAILRTVQYQIAGLLEYTKAHPNELLPAPISLIYYHGKRSVKNKPTQVSDLFASQDFLPYFANPIFHDITQMSDEELKTHGSMSGIDLLCKSIYAKPSVKRLDEILPILSGESRQIQQYVVSYVLRCWNIDPNLITNIAIKHFDKRTVMTAAEQLEKRGMQRGMERGMQRGMQRGMEQQRIAIAKQMLQAGESSIKIRQYTGLSQRQINQLKREEA